MPVEKPRVLIVDDESDLVAVLRLGLEAEGFAVTAVGDGVTGLREAQEGRPDLVLLDLMLPRLDGYQVCRALKFDERYRHLPVVILSARAGERDRRLAADVGADDFITKPYEMDDLVRRLRRQLEARDRRCA